jgi:hypothetical protein
MGKSSKTSSEMNTPGEAVLAGRGLAEEGTIGEVAGAGLPSLASIVNSPSAPSANSSFWFFNLK